MSDVDDIEDLDGLAAVEHITRPIPAFGTFRWVDLSDDVKEQYRQRVRDENEEDDGVSNDSLLPEGVTEILTHETSDRFEKITIERQIGPGQRGLPDLLRDMATYIETEPYPEAYLDRIEIRAGRAVLRVQARPVVHHYEVEVRWCESRER